MRVHSVEKSVQKIAEFLYLAVTDRVTDRDWSRRVAAAHDPGCANDIINSPLLRLDSELSSSGSDVPSSSSLPSHSPLSGCQAAVLWVASGAPP